MSNRTALLRPITPRPPTWPCFVDTSHGQADVIVSEAVALCGQCALPHRELIWEGTADDAAWRALLKGDES